MQEELERMHTECVKRVILFFFHSYNVHLFI